MGKKLTCVVLTHENAGTPHLDELRKTNPELDIEIYKSAPGRGAFPNCDRNIRDWTIKNPEAGPVLFLEYDVRVTGTLRGMFCEQFDVEGAWLLRDVVKNKHFTFLPSVFRLPEEIRSSACVLAPLAVLWFSESALRALRDPDLHDIFEKSMDSEVRLPSVLAWKGLRITDNPRLSCVRCQTRQLPKNRTSVIMHPVKN